MPGGFQAWQPPREVPASAELSATYDLRRPPADPDPGPMIGVTVSNSPGSHPFAGLLMLATGNSPAEQPRVVDVDGRRGLWSVDAANHQRLLSWSIGNGATVEILADGAGLDDFTLDQALEIARDIRQVPRTDPRLPPATLPG